MKRILASLIFFTRLPFWRLADVDKKYYERVVPLWPLVGWLTGGIMALVFFLTSMVLPLSVAIVLTIISRIFVTGALHEDGFADFCDGFGGGVGRERILAIMKDSHIGTYGVLGLVMYFLLFYTILTSLADSVGNKTAMALLLVSVDTLAKYLSSTIIYHLPYARKEAEAKNKLVYQRTPFGEKLMSLVLAILPMCLMFLLESNCEKVNTPIANSDIVNSLIVSCLVAFVVAFAIKELLFLWMRRCIQGYTGDCCGATFIITELTIYLTMLCIMNCAL